MGARRKTRGDDGTGFDALARETPARLDVGRAGQRYTTAAMLALRADHARAVDAVMTLVPNDWARRNGLIEVRSQAESREDFLLHPERGRRIAAADLAAVKRLAPRGKGKASKPVVLICVGDGLSSSAVEKNGAPLLKALTKTLAARYRLVKPIFIRNARVRIEDHLGALIRPDVVCMIIGERPGLATAESLSAYVIYRPSLKSIEPDRTVISNIHRGGIPVAAAARTIAALIDDAIEHRASGAKLAKVTASSPA
jgi:ethanolamine ammonia-lyase small subunit